VEHLGDLAIVGVGNMGSAMVDGLLRAGVDARTLVLVEASAERRAQLATAYPTARIAASVDAHDGVVDGAVIAVKPGDVDAACTALAARGVRRVISIAAGVTLSRLQDRCGGDVAVVRAMPNTPAVVGKSTTAMATSGNCVGADVAWARAILGAIGVVVELPESSIDAFTGLIGSGPAYVFYVAEALLDAARAAGLPRPEELVASLLVGAAALVEREPESPAELRRRVTSPNGTTAAGIAALDDRGVHDAFVAAVEQATARSRELGSSPR
jgi:pyrroline-5-carboxylate reductase